MKTQVLWRKYGLDLAGIQCRDLKAQLADRDIVIEDNTRKALGELSPGEQKNVVLGIRSFFSTAVSYLQEELSLSNQLLRQLGCMNPAKRKEEPTVLSIQQLATTLQPNLNDTGIVDEWKAFQLDGDLPAYDLKERIELFWNKVFDLQGPDGNNRYKVMPAVVKSALVLAQTNADSEHSLSVNARIITDDRSLLGEKTVIGLHVVKEAVQFFDPVSSRQEQIPIDIKLKESVRSAHASYREHLEKEKEMERKKKGEEAK